jgi:tRNA(adenine34) deaminase
MWNENNRTSDPARSTTTEPPIAADERWMRRALEEARAAALHRDVPVGAVAVLVDPARGTLAAAGHNRREIDRDPTAHAEVIALRALASVAGHWNLEGATLYVTQEPCPMCAGAIVNARIKRLVFGCDNPKAGAVRTLYRLADEGRLNHRAEVHGGVLAGECGALLTDFFRTLRSTP